MKTAATQTRLQEERALEKGGYRLDRWAIGVNVDMEDLDGESPFCTSQSVLTSHIMTRWWWLKPEGQLWNYAARYWMLQAEERSM